MKKKLKIYKVAAGDEEKFVEASNASRARQFGKAILKAEPVVSMVHELPPGAKVENG